MPVSTSLDKFLSFLWTVSKNNAIFLPKNVVRCLDIQIGELINVHTLTGQILTSVVGARHIIYLPRKLALAVNINDGDLVLLELQVKDRAILQGVET